MDLRTKGFTLIEVLVALGVLLLLITLAVPALTGSVQGTKADTDIDDLRRALNFARMTAIDRGVTTRIRPTVQGSVWSSELTVYDSTGAEPNVLRVVPAMSSGATLTLTSDVTSIDFNNLGGLSAPATPVTFNYVRGAQSRTLSVCLNGRIVLGGSCG
ncbi:prepilin-type N-terminal cleavage/methylation domain-containing protein [Pseudomonas sp. Fig-3]|mgnify:FL=1|jgi:type IV fimbrial biogenesis protein FimU|uniref:GspH/FimT family pseudopilin n=1 Tax=Pseudomonas TaxID=286 RepID=UPI0006404957|nr:MULTISPECIES: GspH/FimT family protein [Pseudomonas]MEA1029797.1 GspH/FimT family protein [Pseudomonas sp. N-137]QKJ37831.1 type II transport protein [Pseudomonas sp. MPDS]TNB77336.1 prepilin-type N-terminal cleavage/methylation domain-containing protein [Pseudomonas sp. Fig-3]WLG23970.1 GspH/FimT family protein [Pseudomonas sp. FP1154]